MRIPPSLPIWSGALAVLGGCAAVPAFPPGLPPLEVVDTRASACPAVAGRYQALGSAHAPDGRALGTPSLARLLDPRLPAEPAATQVVVSGPADGVIRIDALAGERPVLRWTQPAITQQACLAAGDRAFGETYVCQDGFVRLGLAYQSAGGRSGARFSADWLWLRRAADGALMVLHTRLDTLLVGYALPLGGGDRVWYRFAPASAPEPGAR